jgi:hypothetical protein
MVELRGILIAPVRTDELSLPIPKDPFTSAIKCLLAKGDIQADGNDAN